MKRVCLLTGASGKLGTAFCRKHAKEYDIAAVRNRSLLKVPTQDQELFDPLSPSAQLEENANPVFAIAANLEEPSERVRALELVLARYGRVDLLVCAAVHSVCGPIVGSEHLSESMLRQFTLNTMAPLYLAALIVRRCWRDCAAENRSVNRNIVNISSTSGLRVYSDRGQSVYAATKAALNVLTLHMAEEFSPFGVRVNAVAPNSFPSIVPTGEVVDAIRHLDQGSQTGEIVELDRQPQLEGI